MDLYTCVTKEIIVSKYFDSLVIFLHQPTKYISTNHTIHTVIPHRHINRLFNDFLSCIHYVIGLTTHYTSTIYHPLTTQYVCIPGHVYCYTLLCCITVFTIQQNFEVLIIIDKNTFNSIQIKTLAHSIIDDGMRYNTIITISRLYVENK